MKKGKIIDSIPVGNINESFSLYLPNSFEKNKKTAIVFIFEPMARGKVGVLPFIEAAEKYNYVLICSNNTRNGPFEANFKFIDNLFDTVFLTFKIDEKQIYLSGFSGGSRLATAVAVLSNKAQGVIACGAGFSGNFEHVPSNHSFSYVGLVGDRDMNYQEMFNVKKWLNKFSIDAEIFTYEDDHRWPPSSQILRAFDWLEVQAYKKGVRVKNDPVIKNVFLNNYKEAKILEDKNQNELSVWEYDRIIRNYSRYFNLDSINAKVTALKKTKRYKREVKVRDVVKEEEDKVLILYYDRFNKEIEKSKLKNDFKWWQKSLKRFNEKYILSDDLYMQKMGKRVGYGIYALAIETAQSHTRNKDYIKALYCHQLISVLLPDNFYSYYLLAKSYALLDCEYLMIENLKIAIEKGMKSKNYILNTNEFSKYLENEKLKTLIKAI